MHVGEEFREGLCTDHIPPNCRFSSIFLPSFLHFLRSRSPYQVNNSTSNMSFMEMSRPSTPIPAEKPRTYHPQPTDREIERALSASEKRHQAGDIGLSSTLHDRKIFRIDKSILIKERSACVQDDRNEKRS